MASTRQPLCPQHLPPWPGRGARGQAEQAAGQPGPLHRPLWLNSSGRGHGTARMMLPQGQAIPACMCFCPGNCRLKPACRQRDASQRHQVHGRVEPEVCAGPPPLADVLDGQKFKAGGQMVLLPPRFGAASTRTPSTACRRLPGHLSQLLRSPG